MVLLALTSGPIITTTKATLPHHIIHKAILKVHTTITTLITGIITGREEDSMATGVSLDTMTMLENGLLSVNRKVETMILTRSHHHQFHHLNLLLT